VTAHPSLAELREMTDAELAARRTEVHWRIATIDGQLIDPDFTRPEMPDWKEKARTALMYSRREVGAINNIAAERASKRKEDGQVETTLLEVLGAFHKEFLAVAKLLEADENDDATQISNAWDWLETTHGVLATLDVRSWLT